MKRFISIQEFLNSFDFSEAPHSNTLRYLYNADYQNGLYIDKSPINSGTNKLVNLLLLYRIAKWTTSGSKVRAAIEFYDPNPNLACSSFLKDLKLSTLFVESKKGSSINEMSLLDKLHIYYSIGDSILDLSSKRLLFKSTSEISVSFSDLSRFGHAVPGQTIGDGKSLFLGVVARDIDNEKLYTDILDKNLYPPVDYRLYPEKIHEKPFAIVRCPYLEKQKPITFDDKSIIEINCPPYVKEYSNKSTVMDSFGQWDDSTKKVDYDIFTKSFNIKLNKPMLSPVEPSSVEVGGVCIFYDTKELERLEKESGLKEDHRKRLKDVYGLVEHWDYEFLD